MNAIETVYRGIRFRSRLEAKWAVFFDAIGWKWQYEPVDFNGYIPDFIIPAHNLLVEVKPFFGVESILQEWRDKICDSEWKGVAAIVGTSLAAIEMTDGTLLDDGDWCCGVFRDFWSGWANGNYRKHEVLLLPDLSCDYSEDGERLMCFDDDDERWVRAHNTTRWMPRRK